MNEHLSETIEQPRETATAQGAAQSVSVCVLNDQGLHARPAARLAQEAQQFDADIRLVLQDVQVDAKSILDILTLAAGQGTVLELRAQGPDAHQALNRLSKMFKARFR